MKSLFRRFPAVVWLLCLLFPIAGIADEPAVISDVSKTESGQMILTQTIEIEAPVGRVWEAYTTGAGWQAWAAPKAEVDLRAGGTILTHYGEDAKIGDRAPTPCTSSTTSRTTCSP